MNKEAEAKRRRALERLERYRIEERRAAVCQRIYADQIMPGATEAQRKLVELRAASKFDKYPETFKKAMRDNGYEPGRSKHYCYDFL